MADNFYSKYPNTGGGSGGVTSLNTLTGALTLVAGSGITITDNGTDQITISADAGPGPFANTTLSNLDSPTAINQDLIFSGATNHVISSGTTGGTSRNLTIFTAVDAVRSGVLNLLTGSNDRSGDINVRTGDGATLVSGNILLRSGDAATTNSGAITARTGGAEVNSGAFSINTGDANTGDSGGISLTTGSAAGNRGQISLIDGSEGTIGDVWTSIGASGEGNWAPGFTLPSLTAGSVLFSNGSTIAQDNVNFFWNDTANTLIVGSNVIDTGIGFNTKIQASSDLTDPSNSSGITNAMDAHFTINAATALFGISSEIRPVLDTGVTNNGGIASFNANTKRSNASDLGAAGFIAGYNSYFEQANGAKSTANYIGYLTGFHNIDGDGTVSNMYDFAALPATSIAAGVVANRYGIYIAPDSNYTKGNWLSGQLLVGGSSYSTPTVILEVAGDMSASTSVTDTGTSAGIFSAASNTTVDGSNATIGINGTATALVQSGAENDKSLGGMNFVVTRGDGTDDGILDAMTGTNSLMFHNSGTGGVTNQVYGFSSLLFSQQGTVTDLYDFFSQRVPAGIGVVTNHYGVYVSNDNDTPVKNYLSGITQIGGSSFSPAADAAVDLHATDKALLLNRLDSTAETALTPSNGMLIYNTTSDTFRGYMGGVWTDIPGAGGSGANTALSNLITTSINQNLIFNTGALAVIKTKNDNTVDTWGLTLATGDSVGFGSGAIAINSGTSDAGSGSVAIESGAATGSAPSGPVNLDSGSVVDATSGNISVLSGSASGIGGSGDLALISGNTGDGLTGLITIATGDTSGAGGTGSITVRTGSNVGGGADPGELVLTTGNPYGAAGGNISMRTPGAQGAATNTGSVTVKAGGPIDGLGGNLILGTDNTQGGTGTSGDLLASTGTASSTGLSGQMMFQTGAAVSESGALTLVTGVTTDNTSGTSGNVQIFSGASAFESGNLSLGTGDGTVADDAWSGEATIVTGNVTGTAHSGKIELFTGTADAGVSGDIILHIGSTTGTPGSIIFEGPINTTASQKVAVRSTTGNVTVNALTDYTVICDDASGTPQNITLPPGVDGLTFDFALTFAALTAGTTYILIPDGVETLDGRVPAIWGSGGASDQPALKITFLSGIWYET